MAIVFVISNLGINSGAVQAASNELQQAHPIDAPALFPSSSIASNPIPNAAPVAQTGNALPGWFDSLPVSPDLSDVAIAENLSVVPDAEDQSTMAALPAWFSLPGSTVQESAPVASVKAADSETESASFQKESAEILPSWFNAKDSISNSSPTLSGSSSTSLGNVLPSPKESAGIESIVSTGVEVILPDEIHHGELITLTVVAINGPTAASNVILTSTMPTGFTPTIQTQNFGDIAANQIITFTAAYTVGPEAVSGTNIVSLTQTGEPEIVKNTPFTVNPSIPASSVVVSGPAEVNNCETVTYTIAFTATDTFIDTENVVMTVTVPAGFTPSEQTYNIGVVHPGETITNTAVFTSACTSSSGEVTAYIAQQGYEGAVSSYKSFIVNPGAITLTKTPSVISASAGEIVTWTISVNSTGYGTVSNVVVTDTLGTGLELVSGELVHTYPLIQPGETVTFTVAARVTACSGLDNNVEAVWGCDACQRETAKASIDLQIKTPALTYTPPVIGIDYCSNSGNVSIPIQNTGQGRANDVFLGVDLNNFTVSNISAGATYDSIRHGFVITDPIEAGATYNLGFDLAFPNVCGASAGGTLVYQPSYQDECGNIFSFPIKTGSWSRSGAAPSLNVSSSMPSEIELGDPITVPVNVNASNITGFVVVTDTIPTGWSVLDADGGEISSNGVVTFVVWNNVPGDSITNFTLVLQSPQENEDNTCEFCGLSAQNQVVARALDCQNCTQSASSQSSTEIQCALNVASAKVVAPASQETCSTYVYTNTYTFASEFDPLADWSSMSLTETLANAQELVPGTVIAYVISGTEQVPLTTTTTIVNDQLVVTFAGGETVAPPGKELKVIYQLQTTGASASACGNASWFDWTYFKTGSALSNSCNIGGGVLSEGVFVNSRAPSMNLGISGLPSIAGSCGVYDITLNLSRAGTTPPYDAVLDVFTNTYAILEVTGFNGLTPVSTTTDSSGYHFFYGDQFATTANASVDLRVQLRCSAVNAPFSAELNYDDNCNNNDDADRTCGTGGTLAAPIVMQPNLILYKFPEVVYATSDRVNWTLTAINSGSGTAYGVNLKDTLGTGLNYAVSSITSTMGSAAGVTPITSTHEVTWTNLTVLPGERYTINFSADIAGCSDLNNTFAGEVTCLGATCNTSSPVTSRVVAPAPAVVNTNNTLPELGSCLTNPVTATVRNAGLVSVINAVITETLPAGMSYETDSAEYVIGAGVTPPSSGWQAAGNPITSGNKLVWDKTTIPALAKLTPSQTIWVRFVTGASCSFTGGRVTVQTAYQNYCNSYTTSAHEYPVTAVPPVVSAVTRAKNITTGGPETTLAYGEPGQDLRFRITLANSSVTPAFNTVISDVIPAEFDIVSVSPATTTQTGRTLVWNVGELDTTSWTGYVTVTMRSDACSITDLPTNVSASWGCDDGCRKTASATARVRSRPSFSEPVLQTDMINSSLNQCGGVLTTTLTNSGPQAYNVILTDTLPTGFVFRSLVSSTTPPSTSPSPGSAQPVWKWSGANTLPSGDTVLVFQVDSGNSGACAVPTPGDNLIEMFYDDACILTSPYSATATTGVDVVFPDLALSIAPPSQTADVGDTITWTLTLKNNGDGIAYNVVVTDTPGAGFTNLNPTDGTYPDGLSTPTVNGGKIVWSPIDLAPGQTWTAKVSAQTVAAGSHLNRVAARGVCGAGCTYTDASVTSDSFISLIKLFEKGPESQTRSIGEPAVFTFTTSLPDEEVVYENLILTDTLPSGLIFSSATGEVHSDMDGSDPIITPITAPTSINGNQLIWAMGNFSGSVEATGVITAVVADIAANEDGVHKINTLDMSYDDSGKHYTFQDTADLDLVEPRIVSTKTVTPTSGIEAGDTLTYNVTFSNTGHSTAYGVVVTDTLAQGVGFGSIVSCSAPTTPTDNGSTVVFGAWIIPAGEAVTCEYTATALNSMKINGTHINTVNANWLSQPQSMSQRRIYDDRPGRAFDQDQDIDTATFTVDTATFSKAGSLNYARIGETIFYTLTVSSPLGALDSAQIVDTLPQGLIYNNDVAFHGISSTSVNVSSPNDGTALVTLTFNTWNMQVSTAPGTITFSARIANTTYTNKGEDKTNSATLTYKNVAGQTVTINGSKTTRLIEPTLTITKTIQSRPNPTDAGDTITYLVTINNPGGANSSTAYDVHFADTLPSELDLVNGGVIITATATVTNNTPVDPSNLVDVSIASLAAGETALVRFQGVVKVATAPNTLISNSGAVTWTSLPSNVTGERDGSGGVNDYSATSSAATFTTQDFSLVKSVAATSESHTINTRAAIGEIFRYRLQVVIPEGTSANLRLRDVLDNNYLQFLNDGTAKVAFVSDNGVDCATSPAASMSSNTLGTLPWICGSDTTIASITPSYVLSDTFVSSVDSTSTANYTANNNDTYALGADPYFKMGDLINNDSDANVEYVVVEFNALVVNTTGGSGSDAGDTFNNTFGERTGTASADHLTSSSSGAVTILEPNIPFISGTNNKTASPITGDAGNTITYTVFYQAASSGNVTDAYDVVMRDDLSALPYTNLTLISATPTGCTTPGTIDNQIVSGVITVTVPHVSPGCRMDIQYKADLTGAVTPGQSIVNTARLTYTSLPGSYGTCSNATGSCVNSVSGFGVPGSTTGERTGSGTAPNDYNGSETATVTIPTVANTKSLIATSETHTSEAGTGTSGSPRLLTIGEVVRYRLVVQLPEGVADVFKIQDRLPTGLTFLDGSAKAAFICDGSCISSDTISGSGLVINGSAPATPTFTLTGSAVSSSATSDNSTYTSGTDVYFKLGTLTNADRDDNAEYVVVEFNALADNSTAGSNDAGDTHQNDFLVTLNSVQNGTASAVVYTKVVEPSVPSLTKSLLTSPSPADAGATAVYRLQFTPASGTNNTAAFDVRVRDLLDSNLIYESLTVANTTSGASYENNSTADTVDVTLSQVDPGVTVQIDVTVRVIETAPAGKIINNSSSMVYTSLPGTNGTTSNPTGSATPGAPGSDTGERYSPITDASSQNDYYASSGTISFTLATPLVDKKNPTPTIYTIGDVVTYTLAVTLPEGTTRDLKVFDRLENSLYQTITAFQIITDSASSGGLLSQSYNGSLPIPSQSIIGNDLILTFGDTQTDDDNNVANNAFLVKVGVRVLDNDHNRTGVSLGNTALVQYTNPNTSATVTVSDGPVNISLTEPQITTTKNVTPLASVVPGDILTYTVRFANSGGSTAYGVTVNDLLAQGVDYNGGSISCADKDATPVASNLTDNGTSLDFGGWDIPAGGYTKCSYTGQAQTTIYVDGAHINTADADWSSQPGSTKPDDRIYNDVGHAWIDTTVDTDTASFNVDGITFSKTDHGLTKATIGDQITYTLYITSPVGTIRNLAINDALPNGIAYNPGSLEYSGIALPVTFTAATMTWDWGLNGAEISASPAHITFTATVNNVIANQAGQNKVNTATLNHQSATGIAQSPLTSSDNFAVIEPNLLIHKAIMGLPDPADAGGVITYSVWITNPVGTDIPTAYNVSLTDTVPSGMEVNTPSIDLIPASGAEFEMVEFSTTGITATFKSMPAGSTAQLNFSATLRQDMVPGETITNTAEVRWTSLPDAPAQERTGADGPGGALNDYAARDQVGLLTNAPDMIKSLVSTSANHTTGSQVTIGEVVTYSIAITLPEGTIPSLIIVDDLPAGMQYVTGTVSLNQSGLGGTIPNPTVTAPAVSGGDVRMEFGSITIDDDNDPTNNHFTLHLAAVVLDESGNKGNPATTLSNHADMQIAGGNWYPSNIVDVTVVEPHMTISKVISPSATEPTEPLTVTLVVGNNGTSTAFDVTVEDPLTDTLLSNFSAVSANCGFSYGAASASGITTISYTGGTIPVGTSCTLVFRANLTDQVEPGMTINNTAVVTHATTLPGSDPEERDEPDVQASDDIQVIGPDLQITKDDGLTVVAPGQTITWTLNITNTGLGSALSAGITDTVPTGTVFYPAGSSAGWSCLSGGVAGSQCTLALGNLNSGDHLTRTFSAFILNPAAPGLTEISNTALVGDNHVHGDDPTPLNNTDTDTDTLQTATVGDRIWEDMNGDSAQTDGEPDLSQNVTITLTWAGPDTVFSGTDNVIYTTTTATGSYNFAGLPAGNFKLKFSQPVGYRFTSQHVGDAAKDSDPNPSNGETQEFTLAGGDNNLTLDAGLYRSPVVGDRVWVDKNGNGIQDSGEAGLPGVSVELFRSSVSLGTTTTDANGVYTFTGMAPGEFHVKFTAPVSYTFTLQNQGGDSSMDSNPYRDSGLTNDFYLTSGETNSTIDAGLFQPVTIGNRVWADTNVNGIQDGGESGISNVTVECFNDEDVSQGTTTTNVSGIYTFTGLIEDSYYLIFTAPSGYAFTLQNQGADTTIDSDADPANGRTSTVSLAAGESNLTLDTGLYSKASVGDRVWLDTNGNGVQDAGETGVSNVSVELFNSEDVSQGTTTTDANGIYTFTELTPGYYYLVFTPTLGYTFTAQTLGAHVAFNSDADPMTGFTLLFELRSGQKDQTRDAGLYQSASLGNYTWVDANGNGLQDSGEAPLPGVQVELFDNWGASLGTTTTNASGYYTFTNVGPGEHNLVFTAPDMYGFTYQEAGSDRAKDSDPDPNNGSTAAFTLVSGQMNDDHDAGLTQMDYGDLPSPYYLVLLANNGARHTVGNLYLGSGVQPEKGDADLESNTASSATDDDGIVRPSGFNWQNGTGGGRVDATASGEGFLSAWIDFNNDLDFYDPGEMVITDCAVITGTQPITFTITDATFPSGLFARFRLYSESTNGTASPNGYGGLGEVEDYAWDFGVTDVNLVKFQTRAETIAITPWLLLTGLVCLGGIAWWLRRREDNG